MKGRATIGRKEEARNRIEEDNTKLADKFDFK